jgi:hypothetical protein
MNSLANHLKKLGEERGYVLPNAAFEVWQFAEKLDEGNTGDPIIPTKPSGAGKDTFWREVVRAGVKKRKVSDRFYLELNKASRKAVAIISRNQGVGAGRKSQPVSIVHESESTWAGASTDNQPSAKTSEKIRERNRLEIKYGKTSFWLHASHYEKLKDLYIRWTVQPSLPKGSTTKKKKSSGSDGSKTTDLDTAQTKGFHEQLFVLVCRYESLMGGGYQAALNEECFDVLLRHFGVAFECFASPLNCRYPAYCSAFPDTDHAFGSCGSFFDFHPTAGAFEANPPFVPLLIQHMVTHMEGEDRAVAVEVIAQEQQR